MQTELDANEEEYVFQVLKRDIGEDCILIRDFKTLSKEEKLKRIFSYIDQVLKRIYTFDVSWSKVYPKRKRDFDRKLLSKNVAIIKVESKNTSEIFKTKFAVWSYEDKPVLIPWKDLSKGLKQKYSTGQIVDN